MAEFSSIQALSTVVGDGGKVLLQLRVAGSQELLQVNNIGMSDLDTLETVILSPWIRIR